MSHFESGVSLDHATLSLGRRSIETDDGAFDVHFYRDQVRARTMMAVVMGDLEDRSALLCRVHSSCVTSECLTALDCDCADQLANGLAAIAAKGRGALFYLLQEGRGAGLTAKARDRMIVQASRNRLSTFDAFAEMGLPADLRSYDGVGVMARALGIRGPIDLLTNNPGKAEAVEAVLATEKIDLRGTVPVRGRASAFNRDYLRAKRQSGHDLAQSPIDRGSMPEAPVEVLPPMRAEHHEHLVSTACYFLPVGLGATSNLTVDWFQMRVIYDLRTARESVLLSLGDEPAQSVGVGSEQGLGLALLDRLPCREATGRVRLRSKLREIRDRGVGRLVVHFDESSPLSGDPFELEAAFFEDLTREIMDARFSRAVEPSDDDSNAWD